MKNAPMLFQLIVLSLIAIPVAASSTTDPVKPLKILTLGKRSLFDVRERECVCVCVRERERELTFLEDGGGLQGLATLLILDDLLKAIAANPGNRNGKPRPCDVFDMIGGIGVGGWLALLLGRFHLDIATCIQVYVEIVRSVVPKTSGEKYRLRCRNANFNQDRLLKKIEQLTEKYDTGKHMAYESKEGPRCQYA